MKFFTRPSHSQKDLGFRLFLVTGVCVNYNSGRKTFEIGGGGGGGGGGEQFVCVLTHASLGVCSTQKN